MKTQALYFPSKGAVEVRERMLGALRPDEIRVRVKVCGVCHGDVSLFHSTSPESFPAFAGHEASGEVEEVGSDVTRFKIGDAVALLGQERFSTHTIARESQAMLIPGPVDDWARWVVEPIACCVNGVAVANIQPDDVVAVVGCGFMGLGLLQCLRHSPARLRIALALREFSLEQARRNGAQVGLRSDADDVVAQIASLAPSRPMPNQYAVPGFEGGPCDVVFEASGTASGLRRASELVRVGGTLVMFGHQEGPTTIDGTLWHMRGIRVLNASPMIATDFTQIFYRTVGLLERGVLDMRTLVSHQASMNGAQGLFERSKDKTYIKGVLTF